MSRISKIATARLSTSFRIAGIITAVMTASLMSSAWAADPPTTATSAPQQTAIPASSDTDPTTGTHIHAKVKDMERITVFPGAVHAAGDAQWADDDTSAPGLPMSREQDAGKP